LAWCIWPAVAHAQSAPEGETTFEVRVENISKRALTLSNGRTAEIPVSGGVWVVHTGANPILILGEIDRGLGLKGLAEAGMAAAFAPNLRGASGVRASGVFDAPLGRPRRRMSSDRADGGGANASRMLQFGQRFEFTLNVRPGARLSIAVMVSQSNDGVLATGNQGIALFDSAGRPVAGDVTSHIAFFDAGTEVNEEPGLGRLQGIRQGAAHAGDPERRPVRLMADAEFGDRWPPVAEIIRVTITPKRVKGT
jgi:hypothetical protein